MMREPDSSVVDDEVFQPNHPQCVNVYMAITKYGVTDVHVVAGTSQHKTSFTNKKGQAARNITGKEYQSVLEKTLLPGATKIFASQGISTWQLMQDNDPSHSCATGVVQRWNSVHGSSVSVLPDWPPHSPDLNPIENLWGWVQERVNRKGCTTFQQFKTALLSELRSVPRGYLVKLYDSMPRRMAAVIENNGGRSKW
jgi:hypothetical protein